MGLEFCLGHFSMVSFAILCKKKKANILIKKYDYCLPHLKTEGNAVEI